MNERFENINLLRAFAATAVVVYHVIEYANWSSFPADGPLLTFRIGWIGVDLFFVISGFVITRSALALWRQDPATFARRYWARRARAHRPALPADLRAVDRAVQAGLVRPGRHPPGCGRSRRT